MRTAGLRGTSHRRKRGRHRPLPAPHEDLVRRRFVADAPDRLWATAVTEHPTGTGKVYCCAVIDAHSRMVVGWSIADHIRAELVVERPADATLAVSSATRQRKPAARRLQPHGPTRVVVEHAFSLSGSSSAQASGLGKRETGVAGPPPRCM